MFNDFKAVELAAQKKELAVQSAKEHENTLIKYETDKKKELNGQSEHCRAALQIANEFVRSGQTPEDEEITIVIKVKSKSAVTRLNAQGANLTFSELGEGTITINLSDFQKQPNYNEFKPLIESFFANTQQICEGAKNANSRVLDKMVKENITNLPAIPALFSADKS